MMWKQARDNARMVVSMPAPVTLMASCWSRVKDFSSGGKEESRRALKTVWGFFSSQPVFDFASMPAIWSDISCKPQLAAICRERQGGEYVVELNDRRHSRLQNLDQRLRQRIDQVNDSWKLRHEMYGLQQVDHGLRERCSEIGLVDETVGSLEKIANDNV